MLPPEPPKEIAEALAFPASARTIDHFFSAVLGRMTLGVSPAGFMTAYFEWLSHLFASPGKQIELMQKAARKASRFVVQVARAAADPETPPCIEPLPQDHRFSAEEWQQAPFSWIYQWFLLNQQWWYNATTGVRGATPQNEEAIESITRQLLDIASPSNFILTNPEVLQAVRAAGGYNFVRGTLNFIEDFHLLYQWCPELYQVVLGSHMTNPATVGCMCLSVPGSRFAGSTGFVILVVTPPPQFLGYPHYSFPATAHPRDSGEIVCSRGSRPGRHHEPPASRYRIRAPGAGKGNPTVSARSCR